MHLLETSKCKIARNIYNMKKFLKRNTSHDIYHEKQFFIKVLFFFFNYIVKNMNLHKNPPIWL